MNDEISKSMPLESLYYSRIGKNIDHVYKSQAYLKHLICCFLTFPVPTN